MLVPWAVDQKYIFLQRLHSMGDWLRLGHFNWKSVVEELQPFSNDWVRYNPRKEIARFGLSVTSLDGGLSGVPDLDSLYEYNKEHGTNYTNQDMNKPTAVYDRCPTVQKILKPYMPWVTRCHFIRLDKGGFFPEHYDHEKLNPAIDEIRMIGFISKSDISSFKFCYEDQLVKGLENGQLYYFNASKHHSVFSFVDECIQLVINLKFDEHLFKQIIENYQYS
jgi:hypothetical protein